MAYEDLKNDVVFRKVFGRHPTVLMGLLNDILEREGPRAITSLEYMPGEQMPLALGTKLSILDVRCREQSGNTFLVEMQLFPVTGFLNRVVYNTCKAYAGTLERGGSYKHLTDVVSVSICNFELWPDKARDAEGQPRVPLVSRWSMREDITGGRGLHQIQYAFMELPKLGDRIPQTPAERWATLFIHAPDLTPTSTQDAHLSSAQREALELAREESFTLEERSLIERAEEEVDQVRRMIEEEQRRTERAEAKAADAEAKAADEARARAEAEARVADVEARLRALEALLAVSKKS